VRILFVRTLSEDLLGLGNKKRANGAKWGGLPQRPGVSQFTDKSAEGAQSDLKWLIPRFQSEPMLQLSGCWPRLLHRAPWRFAHVFIHKLLAFGYRATARTSSNQSRFACMAATASLSVGLCG
jgi:hypothetical protein